MEKKTIQLLQKGLFETKLMDSRVKTRTMTAKEKIFGHLLGPLGMIMLVNVIGALLELYYTEQVPLDSMYGAGSYITMTTTRSIVGTFFGLVIAWLIQHTGSRQGRVRPWMLIGGCIAAASATFMFMIPQEASFTHMAVVWASNILYTVVGCGLYNTSGNLVALCTRSFDERTTASFLRKISLTLISGILIGLERTKRLKEAGIRTHFLVACSSAAVMLVSKYGFADLALAAFPGTSGADGARLAAQVVSGIGFLGAGMIFRSDAKVSGLTTAAGLWATAGIGLTVGAGLYIPAIFCTLLILVVQALTHRLSFRKDTLVIRTLKVRASKGPDFRRTIASILEENRWFIRGDSIQKSEDGTYTYTFRLQSDRGDSSEELLRRLESEEDILSYNLNTSE